MLCLDPVSPAWPRVGRCRRLQGTVRPILAFLGSTTPTTHSLREQPPAAAVPSKQKAQEGAQPTGLPQAQDECRMGWGRTSSSLSKESKIQRTTIILKHDSWAHKPPIFSIAKSAWQKSWQRTVISTGDLRTCNIFTQATLEVSSINHYIAHIRHHF